MLLPPFGPWGARGRAVCSHGLPQRGTGPSRPCWAGRESANAGGRSAVQRMYSAVLYSRLYLNNGATPGHRMDKRIRIPVAS